MVFFSLLPRPFAAAGELQTLIVKIRSENDLPKLETYGSAELLFDNIYRLQFPTSNFQPLQAQPWIIFVEPDQIMKTAVNSADPLFVLDTGEQDKQCELCSVHVFPPLYEQNTDRLGQADNQ